MLCVSLARNAFIAVSADQMQLDVFVLPSGQLVHVYRTVLNWRLCDFVQVGSYVSSLHLVLRYMREQYNTANGAEPSEPQAHPLISSSSYIFAVY